jgi:hypothetical protein
VTALSGCSDPDFVCIPIQPSVKPQNQLSPKADHAFRIARGSGELRSRRLPQRSP